MTLVMPGMVSTEFARNAIGRAAGRADLFGLSRADGRAGRRHGRRDHRASGRRGVHQSVVGGDGDEDISRMSGRSSRKARNPWAAPQSQRATMNRRLMRGDRVATLRCNVGPSVLAQQSDPRAVQPERPTVATHAGTVATGYLEIETGVERDRFDPLTIGYGAPTVFKIGVGSRAQLSIGVPLSRPSRGSLGLGDMGVGVKWRFVRRRADCWRLCFAAVGQIPERFASEWNGHRHDGRVVARDLESQVW